MQHNSFLECFCKDGVARYAPSASWGGHLIKPLPTQPFCSGRGWDLEMDIQEAMDARAAFGAMMVVLDN